MERVLDDVLGIFEAARILPGEGHRGAQIAPHEDVESSSVATLGRPRQLLIGPILSIAHGSVPGAYVH